MANRIQVKARYAKPIIKDYEINNGKSTYRLINGMTSPMTQDKLAEFYETAKQKGNPLPMSAPQLFSVIEDAANSGNKDLINFIREGLQKYPNTLSKVFYNPRGQNDETIHLCNTSDAYAIIGNIVGKDGFIKDIDNKNALKYLIGTKDIQKINRTSNKINAKPTFIWRANSKPNEQLEEIVRVYAFSDRFLLLAGGDFFGVYPSFLVEQVK